MSMATGSTVENTLPSPRVVLFLGAGASAPLGKKLMGDFIDLLSDVRAVGDSRLFKSIIAKRKDLEFLLEELADLREKSYLPDELLKIGKPTLSPPVKLPLLSAGGTRAVFDELANEADLLDYTIRGQIFHHYRSFENPERVHQHFIPLIDEVSGMLPHDEPIIVFTTNYDLGIEVFCREARDKFALTDGFAFDAVFQEMVWQSDFIERWKPTGNDKRDIILIKLHGSTNWLRRGDRIVRGPEVYTAYDPLVSNVLIYPAERKVTVGDPFFTGYHYLQQILANAECLVSVGYSFRDMDALTRVKSAVRSNPKFRIAVITPDAKPLAERLSKSGIRAEPFTQPYYPPHSNESFIQTLRNFFGGAR